MLAVIVLLVAAPATVAATQERELTFSAGIRSGGDLDVGIQNASIEPTPALGITFDAPLRKPTKRWILFWSRQLAEADTGDFLSSGSSSFDLNIDYLHVGGMYRPGKGFVFFSTGLTYVDPREGGFDDDIGWSLAIGGGRIVSLSERLSLRFEARGYANMTEISLQGVCGGVGCKAEIHGSGAFQLDALVGLGVRF